MCIGDFNKVVNGTEKVGGNVRPSNLMQAFQQTLVECGLIDLGYYGPKYTWSSCQEGLDLIKERLDRGVANHEWQTQYPNTRIMVEATITSNHAFLFLNTLSCGQRSRKLNRFRYDSHWALEDGFRETIATAWNQYGHQDMGWGRVEKKLRACVQGV